MAEEAFFDVSGPAVTCPVRTLPEFIRNEGLAANVLLCAGDLCDGASPQGLKVAWQQLHIIKDSLGCDKLYATVGNHDMDSRHINSAYDAKEAIQTLNPPFPVDDEILANKFWSRNYCICEQDDVRICLLNSSAYHGQSNEYKRGRISKVTIEAIKDELRNLPRKRVNLLLCHHPPHSQTENYQGEGDQIHFGDDLVELLSDGSLGDWVILFGHKHFPRLEYSRGYDSAPIVFSAATLSAALYSEYGLMAANQFHVITLERKIIDRYGLVFRVESFDWDNVGGWKRSQYERGLPGSCGVGYRCNPRVMGRRIVEYLLSNKRDSYEWKEVLLNLEELNFLTYRALCEVVLQVELLSDFKFVFGGEPKRSAIISITRGIS